MVHLYKIVRVLGAKIHLFSLLHHTICVDGPFQVVRDVHSEELEVFHALYCSPVDVDGGVLSLLSSEVHDQLLCFVD